jgi:thiol-disulfide isomerase/thioredoxin
MKFLTRDGCHLCDEARPVVQRVARRLRVDVVEVDIDSDDDLTARYGLRIPVVLGDAGQVLGEGLIDARELRRAMREVMG